MRRRLEPGEWMALGLLTGGLSASATLIAFGHEPTSTCVRRSTVARGVVTFLWLHLMFDLPFDPIRHAGDWLDDWVKVARAA